MKNIFTKIIASIAVILTLLPIQFSDAQVQRNPVIEACTGTWCQWCPCGHDIIDAILVNMPNAIAIEYHGPANTPSDPWSVFPGNEIINLLGYTGYPTGVIDRTSAPQSRSAWAGMMTQRYSVAATVDITMDKDYNKVTRELDVTIHVTAQQNLTDEYRLSFLILESGLVYPQTGNGSCPGATSYTHNHVVRAMINGAQGEELNGTTPWNNGATISKNIQYTVPAALVADSCELVAFVYKVQSPIYNGEIQQGEKWPLVSPDYVATISSTSPDVIIENNTPAEFTATLRNQGLLDDVYYVDASVDVTGWTGEFTTANGTFSFGVTDSIAVATGDSAVVSIVVNPNGIDGFGTAQVQFTSQNDPGVIALAAFHVVTTTGIDLLVIDASGENYGSAITGSLDNVYSGTYGIVSDEAVNNPDADLSTYQIVMWSSGDVVPVFTSEQVNALQDYLDQNGLLFINGQDIGADIFEAGGQSQFAQSFFNNYLHASYVANFGGSYFITGVAGDPIGDGFAFPLGASLYDRSPDQVAPYDTNATAVLKFSSSTNYAGLKADNENYRIVYFAIGLEQIADAAIRDTVISRVITWLKEGVLVGVDDKDPAIVESFTLNQNYPNPFNPSTRISYSIAEDAQVSLKVYDIMGAEIIELVNQKQSAGNYEIQFDASNLSSGMYFYKLSAGDFTSIKKMTLLK